MLRSSVALLCYSLYWQSDHYFTIFETFEAWNVIIDYQFPLHHLPPTNTWIFGTVVLSPSPLSPLARGGYVSH